MLFPNHAQAHFQCHHVFNPQIAALFQNRLNVKGKEFTAVEMTLKSAKAMNFKWNTSHYKINVKLASVSKELCWEISWKILFWKEIAQQGKCSGWVVGIFAIFVRSPSSGKKFLITLTTSLQLWPSCAFCCIAQICTTNQFKPQRISSRNSKSS